MLAIIASLLEKPEFPSNYYSTPDLSLWIVAIVLSLISVWIFLSRSSKAEHEQSKSLFMGLAILFLMMATMRMFYVIGVKGPEQNYDFWINLGYTAGIGGMGYFLFEMEKNSLKKTHFLFTIINVVGFISGIMGTFKIVARNIPLVISTIVSTADIVLIVGIYIYFIFISPGELKKRGLYNFFGILITFMGVSMDSELFYLTLWPAMPVILPPIMRIVGNLIILYYQRLI